MASQLLNYLHKFSLFCQIGSINYIYQWFISLHESYDCLNRWLIYLLFALLTEMKFNFDNNSTNNNTNYGKIFTMAAEEVTKKPVYAPEGEELFYFLFNSTDIEEIMNTDYLFCRDRYPHHCFIPFISYQNPVVPPPRSKFYHSFWCKK